MKITLFNYELGKVVAAIQNVRKFTEKIPVSINLKLDEMNDELFPPMKRFENRRPELMSEHIAQNGDGTFKTERSLEGLRYIFKSDEDEEQYLSIAEKEHEFDFELLTKEEIMQLATGKDKNGNSDLHLQYLKLVTEGYANRAEKNNDNEKDEEE